MKYFSLSGDTYVIFPLPALLGSVLVMGLILTVMALVLPDFRLRNHAYEQWRCLLLLVPLAVLPAILAWQQSEMALLSALLLLGLFVALFARRHPLRCILALIMVGISLCIAVLADELDIVMRNLYSAPVSTVRFSLLVAMASGGGPGKCHLQGEGWCG